MFRRAAEIPVGTLTGEQIKALKLIVGGRDDGYRAMSYDLRVGTIIDPDGVRQSSYKIPAQGIVEVIAAETVSLPLSVAGHVSVKTTLCNEGLLALNIGIVDPGYSGKISSFLVNFGKDEQLLSKDDVFLRSTFQKLSGESKFARKTDVPDEDYTKARQKQVVTGFGRTFLNTEGVIDRFVDQSIKKARNAILGYVSLAALLLGTITFLLNFGSFAVFQRWIDPKVVISGQAEMDFDKLVQENQRLSNRVRVLESDIRAIEAKSRTTDLEAQGQPKADR